MLLAKLVARQHREGWSDIRMARELGVPRSSWQLTRTGKVSLGGRIARAAQRRFPELSADAISFLLSEASPEAASDSAQADLSA